MILPALRLTTAVSHVKTTPHMMWMVKVLFTLILLIILLIANGPLNFLAVS